MIHFGSDGTPRRESPEWTNFLSRALSSFEDFFNIASHVPDDVQDHAMDAYEQLVRAHGPQLDSLFA
jgi:hypothetical protein